MLGRWRSRLDRWRSRLDNGVERRVLSTGDPPEGDRERGEKEREGVLFIQVSVSDSAP